MGMQINTNLAALNSYRNLSSTQNDLSKSLEKLSSGLRINRAADDAAGLAISEGLRAQIGGLTVAARNAQDGISVIQTVEGSLTEVHSILQRMRDLAVQAGNDSNSDEARDAITTEAGALREELGRISESTNFNGIQLLDGTEGSLSFQVGADGAASSQIDVSLTGADVGTVVDALDFGVTAVQAGSTATVSFADGFEITQGSTVVTVAAPGTAPTSNTGVAANLNADEGFAQNFTASVDDAGALVVTSKSTSTDAITLEQDVTTAGTYADAVVLTDASTTLGFDTAAAAQASINEIDGQITAISTARAELGAVQNRFESAINTLNVSKENITAAESRIRDTDMAEEMVNYTRANLLSQAGTAMLAQANQSNSGILQLLR
ncbi:MAG: flagellin [Homoserinimonas sp.]